MRATRCFLFVGLVALAGCGGDDTDAPKGSETAESASTTVAGPALPAECEAPFNFDLRAANAYADLPVIEEPNFEFTSSLAVRLQPGIYTLYLADFEIDPETFSDFETDHPPAGKTLATVTINAFRSAGTEDLEFDELAVGDVVPAGNAVDGERELGVVLERGLAAGGEEPSDLYNSSSGAEGDAEVIAADAEHLCLRIDYTDYENASVTNGVADEYPEQKHLVGTFGATIVDF